MINFNSIEEALACLEKQIPINLKLIGEEVKKILTDNIDEWWYNAHDHPYYDRTHDYINSVRCSSATKTANGQYQVRIYFATHDITPNIVDNGKWNQHASIYGEDVSMAIPSYIEYGNNSPIYSYEGTHPVEKTKDQIIQDNLIQTRMIQFLGDYGFNCSII